MASPYKEAVLATSGLVSLWGMGEASGNEPDLKSSNNAEPEGGLERAQASLLPNGEGKSAKFNGTTGNFKVPNNASLELENTLSFEAWVKRAVEGAQQYVFDLGSGSFGCFANGASDNLLYLDRSGVATDTKSSVTVNTSVHHVVITKNGATRAIYIDGVDRTTLIASQTGAKSNAVKRIGRMSSAASAFWNGHLQYVAVYNTALSQATVEEHYAKGSASTTPGSAQFPLSFRNPVVNF